MEHIKNQPYLKYRDQINCDSAFTTLEMRVCSNIHYQKNDSLMWVTYRKLEDRLTELEREESITLLKEAQDEWQEYKSTQCKMRCNMYKGGSIEAVVYLRCLSDVTDKRREELHKMLEEMDF